MTKKNYGRKFVLCENQITDECKKYHAWLPQTLTDTDNLLQLPPKQVVEDKPEGKRPVLKRGTRVEKEKVNEDEPVDDVHSGKHHWRF